MDRSTTRTIPDTALDTDADATRRAALHAELGMWRDCFTDYATAHAPASAAHTAASSPTVAEAGRIFFGLLLDAARADGVSAAELRWSLHHVLGSWRELYPGTAHTGTLRDFLGAAVTGVLL